MASRQEEKERRRAERMAAEQAAAAAQSRTRRIQMALAALLAIGVVVGIVLSVGGGGDGGGEGPKAPDGGGTIPAQRITDLAAAAKAAGCELKSPDLEGRGHTTEPVRYKSNPPTSGSHDPTAALDGIYEPESAPTAEQAVHALEHGRINVQYRPGTTPAQLAQLETLASEPLNGKDGYKVLLFQNGTEMPYAVAATSWGQLLGCPRFRPGIFDAVRAFRARYVDKGPEVGIPPTN